MIKCISAPEKRLCLVLESEDGAWLWNLAMVEVHWDNDVPVLNNNANHISPLGYRFKVRTNSLPYIKSLYCFNEGAWIPAATDRTYTSNIARVKKCLQILILFSLNRKIRWYTVEPGTPNTMSREIVTYKTAGPFLMNVKPGPSLHRTTAWCPKIIAVHHLSTLHSQKGSSSFPNVWGHWNEHLCRRRGLMGVFHRGSHRDIFMFLPPLPEL